MDFFPPNNDEVSHSDITASFTNFLVTATSGCNWLNGEAIYGNENIFEIGGEGWNVTLSECELSENQIFEHHYFYEFWSIDFQNIPQPFHYEITLNEDVLSLIVTNSLGSKAYYNNTQLSTSEVSDFVQNDLFLTFKNEDLIFKNSNFIKPYNVQIFNLNGQKLMEFKISDVERMNTSQLPKAIYLIKVIDKKGNIYHKKVRK
ncbi:MAG: T9SS type A sorting domain-containing protein [Weeksellaceae bacterium]